MLELARVQALLFDVDGTLSDTDDAIVRRLSRWLRPLRPWLGDPQVAARRLVMWGESPTNALLGWGDRLGLDNLLAHLGDAWQALPLPRRWRRFLLIPGVREMLAALAPRFPLGIVSVSGWHRTQAFLDQFDLNRFFQVVVTGQTCKHTKPYPDPIWWAAEQLGVPPTACVMIGDTTVDIRAGRAAGAQTVGVLCGFGTEDELRAAGADLILPSTAELLSVLAVTA